METFGEASPNAPKAYHHNASRALHSKFGSPHVWSKLRPVFYFKIAETRAHALRAASSSLAFICATEGAMCACDGAARGPWIRLRRARGLAFGTLGCSSGRVPRGRFWARIVSGRRVSVTQSASRMENRYYMSVRFWEALGGAQRRRYGSVLIHFPREIGRTAQCECTVGPSPPFALATTLPSP